MLKVQAPILAAMLVLSGCAAIQDQEARDSENILSEAGFHREAQSAARGATGDRGALPARRLTRVTADGSLAYEFYDPQFCQCVYVGGPNEYAKLQELRQQRLADHAWYMKTSSPITAAAPPETWGPWQPEGLDVK
jgi:hypothetical protein